MSASARKRLALSGTSRIVCQSAFISPGEAWSRSFGGYFKGDERITFAPSGNATLVEWRVNYTPPFGIIGQLGALILMARIYQNELEGSLENLKAALEV
jgi:hypothetical protein